jgi:hypothetical protein
MQEVTKEIKTSSLEDSIKKVTPKSAIMPSIYGAPEIHKEEVPIRPIINMIGSPMYFLAKFFTKNLLPLASIHPPS